MHGRERMDVVEREHLVVLVDLLATGSRRARSCRRCSSGSSSHRCHPRCLAIATMRRRSSGRGRPFRRWPDSALAPRELGAARPPGRARAAASSTRQWNHRSATSATMREFITVLRRHDRLGRLLADLLQDRVVALREQRRDVRRRRIGALARLDRRRERGRARRVRRSDASVIAIDRPSGPSAPARPSSSAPSSSRW